VEEPDLRQRCQIAANKVLDAIGTHNENLKLLMLGYILDRIPAVCEIVIDTGGEPMNTEIIETRAVIHKTSEPGKIMSKTDAREQANKDVSKVYKVGRLWRFTVFDDSTNEWIESPLMASEAQAEKIRNMAFDSRFRYLLGEE